MPEVDKENPYRAPLNDERPGSAAPSDVTPLSAWIAFVLSIVPGIALLSLLIAFLFIDLPPAPWRIDRLPGSLLFGVLLAGPLGLVIAITSLKERKTRIGWYALALGAVGTGIVILVLWQQAAEGKRQIPAQLRTSLPSPLYSREAAAVRSRVREPTESAPDLPQAPEGRHSRATCQCRPSGADAFA
jgi:hypothetical protein